jgi:hypothetical protein
VATRILDATSECLRVRVNAGLCVLVPISLLTLLGGVLCATVAYRGEIELDDQSLRYRRWHFDCWPIEVLKIPRTEIQSVDCRIPANSWLNSLEVEVQTISQIYTLELPGTDGEIKARLVQELRTKLGQSDTGLRYWDITSMPLAILAAIVLLAGLFILSLGQTVHITLDATQQTATLHIRGWLFPLARTITRPLRSLVLVKSFRVTDRPHYGLAGFQVHLGFSAAGRKREVDEIFDLAKFAYFTASGSEFLAHILHVWLQLHSSNSSAQNTVKKKKRLVQG